MRLSYETVAQTSREHPSFLTVAIAKLLSFLIFNGWVDKIFQFLRKGVRSTCVSGLTGELYYSIVSKKLPDPFHACFSY